MSIVAIEQQLEHPLAVAIVRHLQAKATTAASLQESITDKGIRAQVGGRSFLAVNAALMTIHVIVLPGELMERAARLLAEAKTVIYFAADRDLLAVVAIADKIKDTSVEAVRALRDAGLTVHMLTGDNRQTAAAIAAQAAVGSFRAEVLPAEKAAFVKDSKRN